jgi:acetylornithine/succinyldiaminopimelate/putrescine aminotransferase/predicted amino acid dehydrogenase
VKPRLFELLHAVGLDVTYHRARGDTLTYRNEEGADVEVLDLLGGYGAAILGHNHPAIVACAREALDQERPFLAQASVRGAAGRLAERLSEVVGERTGGKRYVVTLANSGTEAVEAAIKHAEMEMAMRIDARLDAMRRTFKRIRKGLRRGEVSVPDGLLGQAATLLPVSQLLDLDDLFSRLLARALEVLDREPTFFAVEGSFHGKSTGSLKLTHNPDYRSPWRRIGLNTVFLPREDETALHAALEAARLEFVTLAIDEGGSVRLRTETLINVTACFVEPIQGEGGIVELSEGFLRALRQAATEARFPLVMDEIQSGMGRTGTFLASEPSGVVADYYVLSKALGGGLAKLSAMLVDANRYVADYGYLHTSTFAEDHLSSVIGLEVIDQVLGDEGALMRRASETGAWLKGRLGELAQRFPGQIRTVRGRGLMLGFQLEPQLESPSPLLRVLSEQSTLAFVLAGHLLREHAIRVAPTLSAHGTIRLEPSAFIERESLGRFLGALEAALVALRDGDAARLVRHLTQASPRESEAGPAEIEVAASSALESEPPRSTERRTPRRVGFLAHFLTPSDLGAWDPSLAHLNDEEGRRLLDRTRGVLEPFVIGEDRITSADGEEVFVTAIGLAFTPEAIMDSFRRGEAAWAIELCERGVDLARDLGCSVLGFGGYTSIVTDNLRAIVEDRMALTSGNSLTSAAALEALFAEAEAQGLSNLHLGVLGAVGNIGAVLADVASDRVQRMTLVGRKGSRRRLARRAESIKVGRDERAQRLGGPDSGELVLEIAEDLGALCSCNLILSATNAPEPVIRAEHVGQDFPVVICDVAAPRDVSPCAEALPNVRYLKGGIVRLPRGQQLGIPGLRLEAGQLYGCLAETLILGLSGYGDDFSYGALTAAHVRRAAQLAARHGFRLGASDAE